MGTTAKTKITVAATIQAPVEKVWDLWTDPKHIVNWNAASDDWHTPRSENDLRVGGRFISRMEAKDGSMGFDFGGVYNEVEKPVLIGYTIDDGRKVNNVFEDRGSETYLKVTFDAEQQNPVEMQRGGWQAILDNFRKYVESQ